MKEIVVDILVDFLLLLLGGLLSWLVALFLSGLIALCFGFEWTLERGTGVWLCCCLLRFSLGQLDTKRKYGHG